MSFEYSTGDSYYVVLTVLLLTVVPSSYFVFGTKKQQTLKSCSCSKCKYKQEKPKSIARIFLYLCWGIILYLLVMVKLYYAKDELWDPYAVLGVSRSSSKAEIRKAFKDLSYKWHPDRVPLLERPKASLKFNEISKALKVLTDPKAMTNWLKYGNADGPKTISFGIALPSWAQSTEVVAGLYIVLLISVLIFVLILSRPKKQMKFDKLTFSVLLELIADQIPNQNLDETIRTKLDEFKKPNNQVLIIAHLKRIHHDKWFILQCYNTTLEAFEISKKQKNLKNVLCCIEMMRCLTMATMPSDSRALHFPHVTMDSLRSIRVIGNNSYLKEINEMLQNNDFKNHFSPLEQKEIKQIANQISEPTIESVKFQDLHGTLHSETEIVKEIIQIDGIKDSVVCCPFFPKVLQNGFWLISTDEKTFLECCFTNSKEQKIMFSKPNGQSFQVITMLVSPYHNVMDQNKTLVKAPPLKQKNDLLASFG